ncbi:MAG: 4-hydroxy-tetrahydrodipicolinate reductase [Clostridia bacterium]|nr:4-hydroxy-tetrahydrodipicolinate reductase [Clostridia bacterium]
MTRAAICGALGHMGRVLKEVMDEDGETRAEFGVDAKIENLGGFTVYDSFEDAPADVDVVVDFSSPRALDGLLEYCVKNKTPAVIATTGYSKEELEKINECSGSIPIFRSANFSLGVNLLQRLVREAAEILPGFDVEIIEKHHNKKADAPSGTALMLAESANTCGKPEIFGRGKASGQRGNEIGIHSVRGGTIVGEHEVMFCGEDEIITLSHSARSKKIFAAGAVKAAKWIIGKAPGMYDMTALLNDTLSW